MASQLDNPSRPAMSATASASARQAAKVKSYVDQQLEKTRKQVKTIDLIAGILILIAFTIAFLILVALIDAWIWPLSAFGRWVCLAILIGGCLAYTVLAIVPLFLKRINPDYAAKMIEEAKPSFRNSLMNYVSLRKHPAEIKPAVLDAVSRQAATDLASVPSDATVDQSKLIRLGFVLIGLTLFAVGYKMLSPKDPLQTVARILAPAGKIAQPAVVKIEDVQPGDAEIFFGEQLSVTAAVGGSHRPEDVRLVYSTLDGHLTEQSISMVPEGTPNQYRVDLSMAGGGIQSSLRYRVVARDGSSPDYEVIVRPNPSIAIESLVFAAPAYTKIPPRTLAGIGDIEAVEGTKVTVHALANLPIKIASIELLNEVIDPNQPLGDIPYESRYKAAAAPIKMQSDGNSATGRIPVTLDSYREKPFASHYRLRFVSTDGDRNQQPNVYPIRVIPDLAPEIEIRNPVQPNVEVPINGRLAIDILASDLDFEIKSVSLNVEHQGNDLIAQKLELSSDDGYRRVTAGYQLRPGELGLKVGDQAVFFATAADNRISHSSEQPDPNTSRTQDYSVTVTDWNQQAEEEKKQAEEDQAKQDPENADKKNGNEEKQDQGNQDQTGDDSQKAEDSDDDKDGTKEGSKQGEEGESEKPGSEGSSSSKNETDDSQGQGEGSSGEKSSGDPGAEKNGDNPPDGQGAGENSEDPENKNSDQESPSGNQDSEGSGDPDGSQNNQAPGDGNQRSEEKPEPGDSSTGDQTPGESRDPESGDGGQQDAADGQPSDDPSDGDMASDGQGQKDDSLTDGSKEQMDKNAPDGDRIKKLQELLGDDDESDSESSDSNPADDQSVDEQPSGDGSEANDSPGDEESRPGDGSQQPDENPSSSGDKTQSPGDEEQQKPDQQPAESKNDSDSKPNDSSDPKENGNKGSATEQKPGNESAADGKKNPNKGDAQTDPRDDKNGTAEDSDNNDSPREQSSKPGMDDATGKQSQDPGGEETDKTGNESGGTDPGKSDSEGNESGNTETGKQESGDSDQGKPGEGDSSESKPTESGNKPGSEGNQDKESGKQENSQNEKPQQGGKSGEGDSSESQPGESGEKSEGTQSGKPEGGKPGGSQSKPSPGGDGTSDSNAGGIGGDGSTTGELIEREDPNYEHAKKATDLVLKKLSEQRYNPDPELLDKMNWTKQDMEKFLKRWEEMKRAAEQGNPAAKKKYEKSLKSLGLRPPGGLRPVKELNETVEGLSEDSAVNRPSPERLPDYNSFLKDLNRVRDK